MHPHEITERAAKLATEHDLVLVEGAGGRMTDWAGQPLRLAGDGRVIAVGDPALLGLVVAALNP